MTANEIFSEEINNFLKKFTEADILEMFSDLTPRKIPSKKDPYFQELIISHPGRQTYIKTLGYQLFNREYLHELEEILKDILQYNSFIELEAGYGTWTLLLNKMGFKGYGVTLEIPSNKKDRHWGLDNNNKFYKMAIKEQLLFLSKIEEFQPHSKPNLILVSWIPYQRGEEIIEFFDKLEYSPEYFLVVGEERGGCTANDIFFDWLEDNFEIEYIFQQYRPFNYIHDIPILYRKKK